MCALNNGREVGTSINNVCLCNGNRSGSSIHNQTINLKLSFIPVLLLPACVCVAEGGYVALTRKVPSEHTHTGRVLTGIQINN